MATPFMGVFSVGQTIDRGIKLYKLSIGRMFIFLLIPNFLIMTPLLMGQAMTGFAAAQSGKAAGLSGGFSILLLAGYAFYAWSYIVLIRYLYSLTTDNPVTSFGQLVRLATAGDFRYIITAITWGLAICFAFICFIIPGLFLINLAYLLAAPICLIERKYFFDGIGRMTKLAKKRWWKTFVINLITFIIMMVPLMASYALLTWAIVQGMASADGAATTTAMRHGGFSLFALIALVIYSAVCALVMPLYSAVGIIHYNSLRSEKESTDIAEQLDSLEPAKT